MMRVLYTVVVKTLFASVSNSYWGWGVLVEPPSPPEGWDTICIFTLINCHFQSQEDIDKKEGGVFIPHIPWTSSRFGAFRVSNFLLL